MTLSDVADVMRMSLAIQVANRRANVTKKTCPYTEAEIQRSQDNIAALFRAASMPLEEEPMIHETTQDIMQRLDKRGPLLEAARRLHAVQNYANSLLMDTHSADVKRVATSILELCRDPLPKLERSDD